MSRVSAPAVVVAPPSAAAARMPAHAVPVPNLSTASWRSVGSQLKSLLLASPLLTATVVVAGAAAAVVSYTASKQVRQRGRERRRIVRMVKSDFKTYRLDILKFLSEQRWNHFDVAQLTRLYDAFASLLDDPRRGVLPLSSLTQVMRRQGIEDERVAHACAKFFDMDGNYQVDFVELVERLNLLQFGSPSRKLEALFNVYDLDNSGKITRAELEQVLRALGNKNRDLMHEVVQQVFKRVDSNQDGQITKQDFLSLADEHAGFTPRFTGAINSHFGLLQ